MKEEDKYNLVKGSPRAQRAWKLFLDKVQKGEGNFNNWQDILRAAGYAESTRPIRVYGGKEWQAALATIDDTKILKKWSQWAQDDDPKLRGYSLRAGENIMKLKGRIISDGGKAYNPVEELDIYDTEESPPGTYNLIDKDGEEQEN